MVGGVNDAIIIIMVLTDISTTTGHPIPLYKRHIA